jgi:hypothetical protein
MSNDGIHQIVGQFISLERRLRQVRKEHTSMMNAGRLRSGRADVGQENVVLCVVECSSVISTRQVPYVATVPSELR